MKHVIVPLLLTLVLSTFVFFGLLEILLFSRNFKRTSPSKPLQSYPQSNLKTVRHIIPGTSGKRDSSDEGHLDDITHKGASTKQSILGKCEEMFQISESFDDKTKVDPRMLDSIRKIKDNMEKDFGGNTLPYTELSHLLPPHIIKNFPKWENSIESNTEQTLNSKDIERLAQKLVEDLQNKGSAITTSEAITIARSYMLDHQRKFSYKLRPGHRLQWMQGRVPFVPCRIRDSFDSESLRHCVQKTVASRSDPFHLALFGDSKIRGLFVTFLAETHKLKYTIQRKDKTMSLQSFLFSLETDNKSLSTAEAYSTSPTGLRISMMYETFQYLQATALHASAGLQQLRRWSTGVEKPPDLLVIGYGQWILFMVHTHYTLKPVVTDTLDYIQGIDKVVIQLLLNLSSKTRVLVLAQSRNRPHVKTAQAAFIYNSYNQKKLEWTDSMFLSILKRLRKFDKIKTGSYETVGLKSSNTTTLAENLPSSARSFIHTDDHKKMLQTNSIAANAYAVFSAKTERQLVAEVETLNLQQPYDLRKYVTMGPWFWDSILPFNLAEIRDCNTMFSHDPISVKLLPITAKISWFNLNYIDPLLKIGVKISELLPSENITNTTLFKLSGLSSLNTHMFFRKVQEMAPHTPIRTVSNEDTSSQPPITTVSTGDTTSQTHIETVSNGDTSSQPPIATVSKGDTTSQAPIETESNLDSTSHKPFSSHHKRKNQRKHGKNILLDGPGAQESMQAQLDYYDEFASAYSWRDLHCTDYSHAGTASEQIEVLQILNLICNRHLNLSPEYCCTPPSVSSTLDGNIV